jgi:ribosomal protein S18 acetylase RimI-like enzyme
MSGQTVEIKPVKVTDLLTITRMAYANMTGVDPQFTELISNPLGRLLGYLMFPFYFGTTGRGFKAVIDGRIAGCAYLHLNKHSGYVFNVNVNHPYRRQGVGKQLMNHLEMVTKSQDRSFLALQVEDENIPAKNLYLDLGYRPFHPHFLRQDFSFELHRVVESAVSLEPLNRNWGRLFFSRYQKIEQRNGDAWAYKAVEDYQENEIQSGGRYWRCLLQGEEAGAARQQKTKGGIQLTLALKPEFWGHVGQSGLVKQLVALLPQDRPRTDLFLSSSSHHKAAVSIFKGMGFREMIQPRVLMVKEIKPTGQ